MSTWAKPGVKCVCIAKHGWFNEDGHDVDGPQYGDIVTVATVSFVEVGGLYIRLSEWVGPEETFLLSGFRPFVTQSEDVALFRKLFVTEGADA